MNRKQIALVVAFVIGFSLFYWLFFAYCGANLNWIADSLTWKSAPGEPPGAGVFGRFIVAAFGIIGLFLSFIAGMSLGEK
jgi:hypothetical protein